MCIYRSKLYIVPLVQVGLSSHFYSRCHYVSNYTSRRPLNLQPWLAAMHYEYGNYLLYTPVCRTSNISVKSTTAPKCTAHQICKSSAETESSSKQPHIPNAARILKNRKIPPQIQEMRRWICNKREQLELCKNASTHPEQTNKQKRHYPICMNDTDEE